ncbi:MAG: nitrate reductase molybdenum cofactor assembly chaperone [Rubrobacteraceae bacterium]
MIFKLLSLLLRYPDDELLEARREVSEAVPNLPDFPPREFMLKFLEYWQNEPPHRLQASYTENFDFKRRGNLYLTYYRYGDQRMRGQALVETKNVYERAGYPPDTTELPDYLPLALEFTTVAPESGLELLAGHRAAIEVIRRSLWHDRSPYAHLIEALCYFLPELDEQAELEMQKLIVQGPPQESVGLEPYGAESPPGGALGNAVSDAPGNVTFHGRKR